MSTFVNLIFILNILVSTRMAELAKFPRSNDYSNLVNRYTRADKDFKAAQEKLSKAIAQRAGPPQKQRIAKSGLKGAAGGAAVGLAIESLPDLVNYVNSETCENTKGEKELRNYLHVSRSDEGCRVYLTTNDELNLLTKGPEERRNLFKKYPVLCTALVKKHQSRLARLNNESVDVEVTSCEENSKEAVVRINGRYYHYHLKGSEGEVEIVSQLGHQPKGSKENVKAPVEAKWLYAKKSFKPVLLSVKEYDDYFPNGNYLRDLNFLQVSYLDIDGKFEALTPVTPKQFLSLSQRNIIGTMAEQSVALKRALPEILACKVTNSRDTKKLIGQAK